MLAKLSKIFCDIFLRKYPWKVHFFHETLGIEEIELLIEFFTKLYPLDNGEYISRYENEFRNILDPQGYAFSFGSGRMALYAILSALNIGEGDEVILPAFTCEVVVICLLYRKIIPIYADIEPYSYNIDAEKIEKLITPRTKAIIAQHTFGVPCNLERIIEIAHKYGIYVIEDCAIALGSEYKGRPVGTVGDAAFFSSDRTKLISTQWGGLAYTKDKTIAKKIKEIYINSPFLPKRTIFNIALQLFFSYFLYSPYLYPIGRYIIAVAYKTRLFFDHLDDKKAFNLPKYYPCRLSNLQCAIGLLQLKKLPKFLEKRKRVINTYIRILKNKGVALNFDVYKDATLRFAFLIKDRKSFIKRWDKYFEVGTWFYSPAIGWEDDLEKIRYVKGNCPVAEFVHSHIINFPTYPRSKRMEKFLYKILENVDSKDIILPNKIKIGDTVCKLSS